MMAFGAGLAERGVLIRCRTLRPDDHAVRIRRPAPAAALALVGRPLRRAKEMVGGFYLLDAGHPRRSRDHRPTMPGGGFRHRRSARMRPCHVL